LELTNEDLSRFVFDFDCMYRAREPTEITVHVGRPGKVVVWNWELPKYFVKDFHDAVLVEVVIDEHLGDVLSNYSEDPVEKFVGQTVQMVVIQTGQSGVGVTQVAKVVNLVQQRTKI
jgi:hypothetical protein